VRVGVRVRVLVVPAASKRWSVVFSKDASMSTLSRILATPKRVMPNISPVGMKGGWRREVRGG
jgi:hypothetical protein